MSKKERRREARDRKAALRGAGATFLDLAQAAGVTYSMAAKWMNVRRDSEKCRGAFERLTRSA